MGFLGEIISWLAGAALFISEAFVDFFSFILGI
jgi:hypothetical protein